MPPIVHSALLAAALVALAAFRSPTSPDTVELGAWGGEHIALEVTNAGAHVEFDCAHGTIDSPLTLDGKGQFAVKGSFTRERGGPVRLDKPSEGQPARYSGSLSGATLTLTVVLTESNQSIGEFTLTRDSKGRLRKCR